MKRKDTGDFYILYLEPGDERETILRAIIGQPKHIVLMLAEQAQLFRRPEEYVALKHLKRQQQKPISFVIARDERVTQLARRNGFPVYRSMHALSEALRMGLTPGASFPMPTVRKTVPLQPPMPEPAYTPRKTVPLLSVEPVITEEQTGPVARTRPAVRVTQALRPEPALEIPVITQIPTTPRPRASVMIAETPVAARRLAVADVPTRPESGPITPLPAPAAELATPTRAARPVTKRRRKSSRLPRAVIALMILALSAAGLGWLLVNFHTPTGSVSAAPPQVGYVYFLSSGQVNTQTNQGIDDEVEVDLHNLANPAPGQPYYAWLLGDESQGDVIVIPLGALHVKQGDARLFYEGTQSHTNLLAMTSRFLVTAEDAGVVPVAPTLDESKWRYYGEFLQIPVKTSGSTNTKSMAGMAEGQYTFLDHLRYLLAADPTLAQDGLPGGLNNWFSQNIEQVLEWAGSMRGAWEESQNAVLIRRQTVRTLAYLDGLSYVARDIPAGTPLALNDRLSRIGLLSVSGPDQNPPSYLDSISFHLNGLLQSGGSTQALRKEVAAITAALNNVRAWLQQVRADARQLAQMSDAQLLQPAALSLINDMITAASGAYAGQVDPATGQMREGAVWIHAQLQSLATLDITAYMASDSPEQIVPTSFQVARASWNVRGGRA